MTHEEPSPEFVKMLDAFPIFSSCFDSLPSFSEESIVSLAQAVQDIFAKSPMCLDISGEFVTIGDLHGHVFDLIRILARFGMPPHRNYLLLGDYVDRGNFSVETIVLIYLLKVLYPANVYVVRGNHEMHALCAQFGFRQEVQATYKSPHVFNVFVKSFGFMPIAARVNGNVFCVHGGIGPKLTSIDVLETIPRPLVEFDQGLADQVLWSDPSGEVDEFQPSQRGSGFVFGQAALNRFLEANNLRLLVRGHQSIEEGVLFQFADKVVTVFSASHYTSETLNPSGVLILKPDGQESFTLDSLDDITRDNVKFESLDAKNKRPIQPLFADSNDVRRIKLGPYNNGSAGQLPGRKSLSISAKVVGSLGNPRKRLELSKLQLG